MSDETKVCFVSWFFVGTSRIFCRYICFNFTLEKDRSKNRLWKRAFTRSAIVRCRKLKRFTVTFRNDCSLLYSSLTAEMRNATSYKGPFTRYDFLHGLNVSTEDSSSERNFSIFWTRAISIPHNSEVCDDPYWQYTDLFVFRFILSVQ